MSVQDTSREAYDAIRATLTTREQAVWDALRRYPGTPTAYELYQAMHAAGTAKDVNDVRPRLTSLDTRRYIESVGKRACTVTGKTAYTWRVRLAHPPTPPAKVEGHDLNVPTTGRLI